MYESLSRDSQWCHFSQKVQRPDFLVCYIRSIDKIDFADKKTQFVSGTDPLKISDLLIAQDEAFQGQL